MGTHSASEPARISYAQHYEDVRLWKALQTWPHRTYVDVGAAHPRNLSVSRLFYERGWRGLNIEPGPHFDDLQADRPEDTNLQVVVSAASGVTPFHIASPYPDLSSTDRTIVEAHRPLVTETETVIRRCFRLDELLSKYMTDKPIAFLKVDVEGAEREVVSSNDWKRFSPSIVVVEAIHPLTHAPSYDSWEPMLLDGGYRMVCDDGINRFYLHETADELEPMLAAPVTPLDGFAPDVWLRHGESRIAALLEEKRAYLGRAVQLDRDSKEAGTLLSLMREERDRLRDELRIMGNRVLAAEATLEAVRTSLIWRMNESAAERFPFLKSLCIARARFRRKRETETDNLREAYKRWTSPGRPLETVIAVEAAKTPPVATSDHPADIIRQNRYAIGRPALLSDAEWTELRDAPLREESIPEQQRQLLLRLREPLVRPASQNEPDLFLIDARALQLQSWCGMKTHSLNVVRHACRFLRQRNIPCAFRKSNLFPPLDERCAALATHEWHPNELARVRVFLQLAPFLQMDEPSLLDLLRGAWIRKASVWLDAIVGLYPRTFLNRADLFWAYQAGLEQLANLDILLPLSDSCAREARDIVGLRPEFFTTRCLPSLQRPFRQHASKRPFSRYLLVLGNSLPHKNPALAVAAFARLAAQHEDECPEGMVIAADLTEDQKASLIDLAMELGLSFRRLHFPGQLPGEAFAQMMASAEATIIPSFHEGFSLPVIESLALEVPVLVSDISAHRELIDVPEFMFMPDDPVSLTDAMLRLLRDRNYALRCQEARLREHYDPAGFETGLNLAMNRMTEQWPKPSARKVSLADAPPNAGHTLSLCKVCELEDFAHPRLKPVIETVFEHEKERLSSDFPMGFEYRKYWEVSMAVLAFREAGLLSGPMDLLGIGAGNEPTSFYLTRFARRVLATDIYREPGWEESASESMLERPAWHWPFFWRPERLQVADMNALNLDLPDESFDGIFSSSSIEHFGDHSDVARALDEMYRVLKPGGVLSVSAEFRIHGPKPGVPGVLMFDAGDIEQLFVGQRNWVLMEPFDSRISQSTLDKPTDLARACEIQNEVVKRVGGLWTHHTRYETYPHIILHMPTHTFTSFHIALRKRK